jgi:hypothetical protein
VADTALQAEAGLKICPGFLEMRGWLADQRQIILLA